MREKPQLSLFAESQERHQEMELSQSWAFPSSVLTTCSVFEKIILRRFIFVYVAFV